MWPRAAFQEIAVSTYLGNTPPGYASDIYNASGRAYPDLSANAGAYHLFSNGDKTLASGTSGSTPIVASMITLINENRLAAGKGPVGFLNPTLYTKSHAFNDVSSTLALFCCHIFLSNFFVQITAGSNPACAKTAFPKAGFQTSAG